MDKDFVAIYKILSYLREAMNFCKADIEKMKADGIGILENSRRWYNLIGMLIDSGHIAGKIEYNLKSDNVFDVEDLRITLKVLEYLELNPIMRRIAGKIG